MRPAFKSASTAICLPGIESSTKRAATSATLVEPLVITIKFIRTSMEKTIIPITKFPPTTKFPKLLMISLTALGPSFPWLRIILVVATFNDSRKSVTIKMRVGKVVKSVGFGT